MGKGDGDCDLLGDGRELPLLPPPLPPSPPLHWHCWVSWGREGRREEGGRGEGAFPAADVSGAGLAGEGAVSHRKDAKNDP